MPLGEFVAEPGLILKGLNFTAQNLVAAFAKVDTRSSVVGGTGREVVKAKG